MTKALLIKSYTQKTTGTQGQWNELDDAPSYIQGISTGKVLDDLTADKLGALISGVPTPWARAKLFKFAFHTIVTPDPNIEEAGLNQFYNMLHGEWRGLIALIALYPDRISFSAPVVMDVKGGDYDIAAAFGRMLFEDKDLWCNQDELLRNPDAQPFIQLIYYRGHLIGGTSPMTGCFTGISYNLGNDATDINWYRNGKLEDPTNILSVEQLQKLFLFVGNLNRNQADFVQKINSQRGTKLPLDIEGFKEISRRWGDELQRKGQNLREQGPIAKYGGLSCPFSILFKSDVPVYLKRDFTFTYTNGTDCKLLGDIQELLSDDKFVIGWCESDDPKQLLADAPVFFLQVKELSQNQTFYFTVPLSEKAIDIFRNTLSGILGYSEGSNTHLSAEITDAGQLAVSLVVEIDGQTVALNTREYEIDWITDCGKVILWPNFVSENWNKYYLYSEYTSDAKEQFHPIFKSEGNFVKTDSGSFYTPTAGESDVVKCKQLITYPKGQVEGDMPKYNIFNSDKAIAGLSATVIDVGKENHAGFLIMRSNKVPDLSTIDLKGNATVGIDFGSNNTCVYYNEENRGAKPVQFENYRMMLVGIENQNGKAVAENNELLFLSNYAAGNGQVKSWLHEHDSRYNSYNESEEIAGGVPVNRPNILVKSMDQFEIHTQAGVLHYNMKWLDNDKGLQKKTAFLKTIWLQACAFLYQNRIRPAQINWSYPGSMMESDVTNLENIFYELQKITPIEGRKPEVGEGAKLITEAEAVCSYALSQDFGLSSNNMFLGIDVGGSTSDILLLAKDSKNGNRATLFRESSVRLAAGIFFNAVKDSETFRKALVSFHNGHKTGVFVANIEEIVRERDKAPFYLNSIFDQLKGEEYDTFYSSIATNAKFVFTIPAYVTGLLLFYSGMLIGKTIKEQHLDAIERIDILTFGKGGRLFHWLRNTPNRRVAEEYYGQCLNAGLQLILDKELLVKYRSEIEVDNKSEVAKGLCNLTELNNKSQKESCDICGEAGVKFTMPDGATKELDVSEELTGQYFDNDMNGFDFSSVANFEIFMNLFLEFITERTNFFRDANTALREELKDLPSKVSSAIRNDPEYKKAQKNKTNGFKFHQPIIIAEGLCFKDTLIRKVFNQ